MYANKILKWLQRKYMGRLIRLYFLYLDIKGAFIYRILGETLSDKIIRDADGNVFCVFLLYQKHGIHNNILNVLEKLAKRGVNIIAVSNLKMKDETKAQIEPFIHRLIVRRNIGRDFGGYRQGVLTLLKDRRYDPQRLLILNDSIFYRKDGLDHFLDEMLSEHEYVGAAENYEFQYHVGSYALGMGPKIIRDKRFKKYWQKYKFTEVRPKVIKRGEMGLNKLIINRIAIRPHVIYGPSKLQLAIKEQGIEKLIEGYKAMPLHFFANREKDIYVHFAKVAEFWNLSFDKEMLAFTDSEKLNRELTGETLLRASTAKRTGELLGFSNDEMIAAVKELNEVELSKELINFTVRSSQIHFASVLFVNYLNCPLIKNDMVVRLIYTPGELQSFANCMSLEEYEEFFYIQTNRGVPTMHWRGFKRAMLDIGYI